MLRCIVAILAICTPTILFAQSAPTADISTPFAPHPPIDPSLAYFGGEMKVEGPKIWRAVNVDRRRNLVSDFIVISDRNSTVTGFVPELKECSASGDASDLLVDKVVPEATTPRRILVLNCSANPLTNEQRVQRLEMAQNYYNTNRKLDRPKDRRAVKAMFEDAINSVPASKL